MMGVEKECKIPTQLLEELSKIELRRPEQWKRVSDIGDMMMDACVKAVYPELEKLPKEERLKKEREALKRCAECIPDLHEIEHGTRKPEALLWSVESLLNQWAKDRKKLQELDV